MDVLLSDKEREALQSVDQLESSPAADVRAIDLVSREHRVFRIIPDLEGAAERFGRALGWICTKELRQICTSKPAQIEVLPGRRAREVWGDPRFVYGVRVGDQPDAGLIAIDSYLGSAFVACQFGGEPETAPPLDEKATVTEYRTVGRLANQVIASLARSLEPMVQLQARVDLAPQRRQIEHPLLSFAVEVTFGEVVSRAYVGLDTAASCFRGRMQAEAPAHRSAEVLAALQKTELELTSILGRAATSVRRVMALQPGDLLVLDTPVDGEIPLRVAGRVKFVGSPVLNRGTISLKISSRVKE